MIEAWHVREALRFRFGSALVDRPGIWEKAAALLRNFAPYRDTFSDLAASLEDVLFNTVYMIRQTRSLRCCSGVLPPLVTVAASRKVGIT